MINILAWGDDLTNDLFWVIFHSIQIDLFSLDSIWERFFMKQTVLKTFLLFRFFHFQCNLIKQNLFSKQQMQSKVVCNRIPEFQLTFSQNS